jgi:hypothetical protein
MKRVNTAMERKVKVRGLEGRPVFSAFNIITTSFMDAVAYGCCSRNLVWEPEVLHRESSAFFKSEQMKALGKS